MRAKCRRFELPAENNSAKSSRNAPRARRYLLRHFLRHVKKYILYIYTLAEPINRS